MADIDLTPQSHRRSRAARRSLSRFGVLYLLVAVVVVIAKLMLGTQIESESAAVERLRNDKNSMLAQRAQLEQLRDRQELLGRELKTLRKLGGESAVGRVFDSIDRALGDGVWFTDWSFMRAGEMVDAEPRAVEAGYLILLKPAEGTQTSKAWRMSTHMEIRGQAMTHSALASFVQRLSAMQTVSEVKILNTNLYELDKRKVVAFELAVIVNQDGARA